MRSKFKLSDLPILLKSDRRFQIGLGIILLILIWPFIDPTRNNQRPARPQLFTPSTGTGKTPGDEGNQDLVTAFKEDLDGMNQRVSNIEKAVEDQSTNLKEFESRTAEVFKKILERVSEQQTGQVITGQNIPPQELPPDGTTPAVAIDDGTLDKLWDEEKDAPAPEPLTPAKLAFIGPGDSVRVQLMTGVNAPTDGTPYPVTLKLIGNVLGPDGSDLPLGEARVIAAAQGSLTDSRALFRLTTLNIRLPNGKRKVVPVDGWIVGEDGIRGMAGVLIDPIGKAIAGAGMTGALAGLGEGIASSNTTTNFGYGGQSSTLVNGNVAEFAAGKGLAGAAYQWGDIIKDRLELLVPVVQVLSGREATAIFAKSATVPDLYDALGEDEFTLAALD